MTPEEKAKYLILQIKNILPRMDYQVLEETAKECAIICVDEVLKETPENVTRLERGGLNNLEFWESVKEEIQKL